jgi:hypothetical protein
MYQWYVIVIKNGLTWPQVTLETRGAFCYQTAHLSQTAHVDFVLRTQAQITHRQRRHALVMPDTSLPKWALVVHEPVVHAPKEHSSQKREILDAWRVQAML